MMNFRIVSIGLAVVFALGQAQAQEGKKADHILVPYGKQRRQVLHLWLPKTKEPALSWRRFSERRHPAKDPQSHSGKIQ